MVILQAKNLRKVYGSGESEVAALDGVNLSVEKGEFLAIVGTSGSGKSTLLNLLGGLDVPTSGSVVMDGKQLELLSDDELTIFRRRKIGFVFQQFNLIPMLNVWENIILPLKLDNNIVLKTSAGGQEFPPGTFTARYFQTKDNVTAGSANATATLNITYQ